MPIDVKRLDAILGRRRFLAVLGGALFGVATRWAAPEVAAAPTPAGCFGAPGCDSCRGTTCTGCFNGRAYGCRLNPNLTCWTTSLVVSGCRNYYNCCDWFRSDFSVCICRGFVFRQC